MKDRNIIRKRSFGGILGNKLSDFTPSIDQDNIEKRKLLRRQEKAHLKAYLKGQKLFGPINEDLYKIQMDITIERQKYNISKIKEGKFDELLDELSIPIKVKSHLVREIWV